MKRGKDSFIEFAGGRFADESEEEFKERMHAIQCLEASLQGEVTVLWDDGTEMTIEDKLQKLRELQDLPPAEFDYEPSDD